MITEAEIQWLAEKCPTLRVNKEHTQVSGILSFRGAYSASEGFTWLLNPQQTASGEVLDAAYKIIITRPKTPGRLPLLKVEDVNIEVTIDRHFYPSGYACVCGSAEKHYFISNYSFLMYLDRLVVPFLYEQTYYNKHNRWPWGEYTHGAAGIFESYDDSEGSREDIESCLQQLRNDSNWKRIAAVLSGRERVTEVSKCFCIKPKNIRECHPRSWMALVKLKNAIREQRISVYVKKVDQNKAEIDTK